MNHIIFLEYLANHAFHRIDLNNEIDNQITQIKEAFKTNNSYLLKKVISNNDYYANEEEVVTD